MANIWFDLLPSSISSLSQWEHKTSQLILHYFLLFLFFWIVLKIFFTEKSWIANVSLWQFIIFLILQLYLQSKSFAKCFWAVWKVKHFWSTLWILVFCSFVLLPFVHLVYIVDQCTVKLLFLECVYRWVQTYLISLSSSDWLHPNE